ncbi:MAG: type II toxin-antitoxin system VapC family toxin [Rhizobiaceae bacterium]|nr:type II toxin-antitoxin system VapC family toxin [Rhizobiaceae bacterium]
MPAVIDSSVAACWALPDEYSPVANVALDLVADNGMVVPALFAYEFRNVLLVNERRKRIAAEAISTALSKVGAIPTQFDSDFDPDRLLVIARRQALSVYDAAYLELALRRDLPLATLDRRLATAASAEGATIVAAAN